MCARRFELSLFVIAAALAAQPAASPRFDVVSIRAVPPNAPPLFRDQDFTPVLPGGQYVNARTPVEWVIAFAYDVKNMSIQLVGLPDWAKNRAFAIAAKPGPDFPKLPPSENCEQVKLMLRAMLADRFGLQLHTEVRNESVYNLEVAKSGIQFKEVDAPLPPAKPGNVGAAMGDSEGRMIGKKSTMASLASVLTLFLKRPVIDRTGLNGYYDFDVKWTSPDVANASSTFGAEGAGLLVSVLQNQLGLRLTKATGPVPYWVVDHIEMPTEN